MIRIRIPMESIERPRPNDEEIKEAADCGVEVLEYDGPRQVELPDFDHHLTRAVYSGMIHSFMPPPSCSYHVLCQIDLSSPAALHDARVETWLEAASHQTGARTGLAYEDRSVILLTLGRVIVYMAPQALSPHSLRALVPRIEETLSQQDNVGDSSGYGFLGALASALVYFHCYFDGHEFFYLGPGPPSGSSTP